ncbi:hypothetical protein FHX37_1782 [Haloactinospora alba]|uniref:Uncharacterized protein n=1 Tax=Haloactinospora alba TaxID=405555 RepID=A0A543NJ31_9ACTN|nr:hypothetical protein FHX37_1782 [Haloactinospora alba]
MSWCEAMIFLASGVACPGCGGSGAFRFPRVAGVPVSGARLPRNMRYNVLSLTFLWYGLFRVVRLLCAASGNTGPLPDPEFR